MSSTPADGAQASSPLPQLWTFVLRSLQPLSVRRDAIHIPKALFKFLFWRLSKKNEIDKLILDLQRHIHLPKLLGILRLLQVFKHSAKQSAFSHNHRFRDPWGDIFPVVCVQPGLEARQCDQCRAELRGATAVREDGSHSAAVRVLEQRLEEVEAAAAQREAEELLGAAWVTWMMNLIYTEV